MITEQGSLIHWNYFLALDDDVAKFSRYVEFSGSNFNTYSIELARILMAASSEVDVVAKLFCKKIDPGKKANNIINYRNIIMKYYPKIATVKAVIPRYGLTFNPLINWESGISPDWWQDYNSVKHNRSLNFERANLSNALNAIAALFILLLYHYQEEADNGLLYPNPTMYATSGDIPSILGSDSRIFYKLWFR